MFKEITSNILLVIFWVTLKKKDMLLSCFMNHEFIFIFLYLFFFI